MDIETSPAPNRLRAGKAEAQRLRTEFQTERSMLFAREWLPFAAAGQTSTPGAFVNLLIGGWPIVAVRGADGVLRAFQNVCRHQALPIVEEASGQCNMLHCRFHDWVYDLTGKLVVAPSIVVPTGQQGEKMRLQAVSLRESTGIVFVRVGEDETQPLPQIDIGDRPFLSAKTTDLSANWKSVIETLLTDEEWELRWPIALKREGKNGSLVRQIVPRSANRTSVIDWRFGEDGNVLPEADAALLAAVPKAPAAEPARNAAIRNFREHLAATVAVEPVEAAVSG